MTAIYAAYKTGILASLAHGFWINPKKSTSKASASYISALDIKFAGELGYTIKLLGMVKKPVRRCVQVSVYPTLPCRTRMCLPTWDVGVFNACFVRGDIVGDALFYGRGAGKDATASAVLSDLVDAPR